MFRDKEQLNIQVGEVCIAMRASDTYALDRLMSLYSDFACDRQPDIVVEFDVIENMSPEEIMPRVINPGFYHKDGVFHFSNKYVSGEYNLYSRTVEVCVEKQLLIRNGERYYLNQLMCLLYNTCNHINGVNRLYSHIIHSSAVIRNGYGILFTGPSGIGKTTIAQMCSNHGNTVIINDEGNLIAQRGVAGVPITVQGIPVIGKLAANHNIAAPLICILLLKQGKKTILRPLDRTAAYKRLMFQVVANVYFGQNDLKAIFNSKADFCEDITAHVPCYELEFTLDSGLLHDTLDSLHQSLISGSKVSCLAK